MENRKWSALIFMLTIVVSYFFIRCIFLECFEKFLALGEYNPGNIGWKQLFTPIGVIICFVLISAMIGSLISFIRDENKRGMEVGLLCGIFWGSVIGIPFSTLFWITTDWETAISLLTYCFIISSIYGLCRGIREELFSKERTNRY